jgi:hypothetical protein
MRSTPNAQSVESRSDNRPSSAWEAVRIRGRRQRPNRSESSLMRIVVGSYLLPNLVPEGFQTLFLTVMVGDGANR